MIKIQYCENGWILTHAEEGEPDRLYVFSHTGSDQSEVEAFRDLLATVDDIYGPTTSRYSEHRIYIRIEPGDKHSSHPDNRLDNLRESGYGPK
jgi:hypothetical protein